MPKKFEWTPRADGKLVYPYSDHIKVEKGGKHGPKDLPVVITADSVTCQVMLTVEEWVWGVGMANYTQHDVFSDVDDGPFELVIKDWVIAALEATSPEHITHIAKSAGREWMFRRWIRDGN